METSKDLTPETTGRIFRKALLSRFVEERLLSLFSEGKLFGTVHTCIGQEMVGAVLSEFLKPGDALFSNHRCHGHFLSFTGDTSGLIAELMGKSTGVSGGMGGSQHLCKDGFYSNGIQGGTVPVAAGIALAKKITDPSQISVVFIGDGTLGEGAIYEAFNVVSKWKLPLLIVLEDNGYSQSTRQEETLAGGILERARAFGIDAVEGDTWNWQELHATAGKAIARVRNQRLPGFIRIQTYRLKAHSKGDDTRSRTEVEPFEAKDPLNRFLKTPTPVSAKLVEELKLEVEAAVRLAEAAEFPQLKKPSTLNGKALKWSESRPLEKIRLVKSLNDTFVQLMKADSKMIFLGEDIHSPYGGAFKTTQSLSELYPDRVFNTPISESCIVGLGTGLALSGFRPIVEIMFGDFLGLAFDQIVNHAAKFEEMYNGQVQVNLIVRTPMGGRRGYGPTHSQTLDRHFLGVPGLQILALNHLMEPAKVYDPLVQNPSGPSLVIENKTQYAQFLGQSLPDGFQLFLSDEQYPTAWIKPQSSQVDVTLLGYGGMSEILCASAEKLFLHHDRIAQVICPTKIYPFNIESLLPALRASSRLVIVEEGQGFAGFGAEIIAQISETAPELLRKVRRVMPPESCIPSSGQLELQVLPGVDHIVQRCLEIV